MKKNLVMILIALFAVSIVGSADVDLSSYPYPFVENGELNTLLVIGKLAAPIDNIAVTGIAMSLQTQIEGKVAVDAIVFDRDIEDVSAQNLIVVGGPCVNTVAHELLNTGKDCSEGFQDGVGNIQLIPTGKGNYALIVAGKWGEDTRVAGIAVAKYYDYKLTGYEKKVSATGSSANEVN